MIERLEDADGRLPAWVIHVDRVEERANNRGSGGCIREGPVCVLVIDVESHGQVCQRAVGHRHVDEGGELQAVDACRKVRRIDAGTLGCRLQEWQVECQQVVADHEVKLGQVGIQ